MDKNTKGIVVASLSLIALGLTYYFVFNKRQNKQLKKVKENLGAKAAVYDDRVEVSFDNNNHKATFYDNNRVFVFDKNNKWIAKGTYSDGGKVMNLDDGREISGGSVWTNLMNIIK